MASDFDSQIIAVNAAFLGQIRGGTVRAAQDAIDQVKRDYHPSEVEIVVDGVSGRPIGQVSFGGVVEAKF